MQCFILHYVFLILLVNFCYSAKCRDESFIWNKPFWMNEYKMNIKSQPHSQRLCQAGADPRGGPDGPGPPPPQKKRKGKKRKGKERKREERRAKTRVRSGPRALTYPYIGQAPAVQLDMRRALDCFQVKLALIRVLGLYVMIETKCRWSLYTRAYKLQRSKVFQDSVNFRSICQIIMLLHSVQGPRYGGARAPPPPPPPSYLKKSILKRNRKKPTKGKAPPKNFFPCKMRDHIFYLHKSAT